MVIASADGTILATFNPPHRGNGRSAPPAFGGLPPGRPVPRTPIALPFGPLAEGRVALPGDPRAPSGRLSTEPVAGGPIAAEPQKEVRPAGAPGVLYRAPRPSSQPPASAIQARDIRSAVGAALAQPATVKSPGIPKQSPPVLQNPLPSRPAPVSKAPHLSHDMPPVRASPQSPPPARPVSAGHGQVQPVQPAGLSPGFPTGLYSRGDTADRAALPAPPAALTGILPGEKEIAFPAAGDPYPPLLMGRPLDGYGVTVMEQNRITPRSPRAALEPEHVSIPTRRSKRVRHPLVIFGNAFLTFFVLLALGIGGALIVGKQHFEAPGPLATEKIVNVPRGGMREIADTLQREGVIDQPLLFMAGVFALKARGDLKAGEYQFARHVSLHQVVETLLEARVVQHPVTIPEGLTSEQIVARLLENDALSGNIKEIPPEGTLLPDTYHFPRGFPRERVIKLMQQAEQRLVNDVWAHRNPDLPLKSPEELVILASLVEKETAKPEERSRVASVFINRLKHKMRLQSDPTIIYGLVGGKGTLGHQIKRSEIEQPTAYNTYVIDGLPPAPIANPGRASLEAAAKPARTKELYFVADGTGGHIFSETYEQQQKNVARLRALEQQQKLPASPVAVDAAPTSDQAAPGDAQPH